MKHCCEEMRTQVSRQCEKHSDPFACHDALIHYVEKFDEYGIIIHDGGTSVQVILYCPWCGACLPESKRDKWFDELEALGFDSPLEQEIPSQFLTGEWYR